MGFPIEVNSLLRVTKDTLDLTKLQVGQKYTIVKDGFRLYPVDIPLEICDEDYTYFGKVVIRRLMLEGNKTALEFEVLIIFGMSDREAFSRNFLKL